MPELPEVETVRRGLERLVVGRRIERCRVLTAKSFSPGDGAVVEGAVVTGARRRAKLLALDLDNGLVLLVHLKMTGQLVVRGRESWGAGHPSDSLVDALPDRSTRVIFDLDDGSRLFFNDQRKFGWMRCLPAADAAELEFVKRLGPEPLDANPWPEFRRRARRHERAVVKAVILDQSVVAGIGNIYADEALWAARVHPSSRVADLSDRKLRAILDAARAVMEESIELGGSTDRNYVDAEGKRGAYLDFAKVFRREGQACPRCGGAIVKTRVAGRGTHLCPRCQRLRRASGPGSA
ncbi:MAG: bifunctional DNA-formamidopyrimidine glycosylase/DNA-(apurinic or apyrimidinic site) lyase [Propionibacteriaceae bacterium]|jgi:formamidopyrimidine-DNA glycosylase|nr:bifunctional DNA-formamidopyrimidine glycosylase/DNA-(apurinic or apyrimidinic site) lyase [Propionibacteriaceae bacterium]